MRQRPGFLSSWRKPPTVPRSANRPSLIRRRVTENRSSCLDYDFDSGTEVASQSSAGGSARQARHRSTRICQGDHDDRGGRPRPQRNRSPSTNGDPRSPTGRTCARSSPFCANFVSRKGLRFQNKKSRSAIYSGSIRPPLPMASKERANPRSAKVSTIGKSPLDSLARYAVRYIIFSASARERERNRWLR
jgi:hypothetical protein